MQKIIAIVLFFWWISSQAQNSFSISGKVVDTQNELIAVGDVLLLSLENDTLVKYASIFEGSFLFENIPECEYRIKISCLGFEPVEKRIEVTKNVSIDFQLYDSTTTLDEVEVIAAKPLVENVKGNLKIDITNPVFSAIPDPMNLLARLPNLQVSADRESVSVIGKGTPLIYLESQRITMAEFQAMAIDDISTIEIITNPSAKYEANGRAVLLVTRNVNTTEGFKLNLSETLSFKRNFNNYTKFKGAFKTGKLTLKGNFAYNDLLQWESHQFEFAIPEADIFSDYRIWVDKNDRVELNSGAGLFYQINDTDYFSVNATRRLQANDAIIDTETFLRQGSSEDEILTETDNDNTKDFISGNLNYANTIGDKTNIFLGAQYSSYLQRLNTDIANNYNATSFNISELREQRYRINVFAYRFDFDTILANGFKCEVGTNISNANANALTNIQFLETNTILDVNYDYSEKNIAGYTTLSGELGKKISFNMGIRLENNIVKGEDEENRIPLVDRENTNLFPKAGLSFQIDSTKNVSFSYAKSISRPNYSNASSIQVFFNPFLEGEGNVNLLPTLTEEVSATYQFSKNSLSFEYFKCKNPTYHTISYTAGENRAVFSLKNLEKESGFNMNLSMPITKGLYSSSNTVSLSVNRIKETFAVVGTVKPYLYLYTDHQFKLGNKTTVSFGGWGLSKRSEGIFERNAMFVFNAAIVKTFFEKLHCSIRFNDITQAMNFEESYSIDGVIADGVYYVDAQEIAFSLKYSFGKSKETPFKNKNIDENINRIR